MTTINVQFADSTNKVIVGVFAGVPDASIANTGTVETSDPMYAAYFNALPESPPFFRAGMPAITTAADDAALATANAKVLADSATAAAAAKEAQDAADAAAAAELAAQIAAAQKAAEEAAAAEAAQDAAGAKAAQDAATASTAATAATTATGTDTQTITTSDVGTVPASVTSDATDNTAAKT